MKQFQTNLILAASAVALTLASLAVVMQGASDEPYMAFRKSDALIQVGGAMVLMLLWVQLGVTILAGVVRDRISKWWLLLLFWIFLCEFYLFHSPAGYVADITRYVAQSR